MRTFALHFNHLGALLPSSGNDRLPRLLLLIALVAALSLTVSLLVTYLIKDSNLLPILDALDRRAMLMLNFAGSKAADNFWFEYSDKATWLPLSVVIVITLLIEHPGSAREKMLFVLAIATIILITDQTASAVIKPWVGRLRPSHDPVLSPFIHYVNGYHGGRHGFVSSHAAINVGITTMLFYIYKDRFSRFTFVVYCSLMCYSRIYLGVHYPGDIIAGGLLGWAVAYLVFHYGRNAIHAFTTECQPKLVLLTFYITIAVIILQ
jgi:undecaprenyl-diphosphatase